LPFDQEKGSYQNRHREYAAGLHRFGQRDPLQYVDGLNLYDCLKSSPLSALDPSGRMWVIGQCSIVKQDSGPSTCKTACDNSGGNTWGITVCDGHGQAICCVCEAKLRANTALPEPLTKLVVGAIDAHENRHREYANARHACRNIPAGSGPRGKPNECQAYDDQEHYIGDQGPRSGCDSEICRNRFKELIDEDEAHCNNQCGSPSSCRASSNYARSHNGFPERPPIPVDTQPSSPPSQPSM
jgi:RHS repeat-associated protein